MLSRAATGCRRQTISNLIVTYPYCLSANSVGIGGEKEKEKEKGEPEELFVIDDLDE